ncbi:hypothetical protein F2Q68_00017071 [Brassica cretica]|uniref:Uncharacterized protein n=1 Tax=Brassica cretica TaxID=69181 RepID=A0A8S9HPK8_BRACR|nr:hypothetical protein F2Q68_00017071 [Brassica cretica]
MNHFQERPSFSKIDTAWRVAAILEAPLSERRSIFPNTSIFPKALTSGTVLKRERRDDREIESERAGFEIESWVQERAGFKRESWVQERAGFELGLREREREREREIWVRDRDSRESRRREGLPLWELKAASASISLGIFGN